MSLRVSPAQASDCEDIYRLVEEIFADYGLAVDPDHDAPGLLGAHHLARAGGGNFWVLRDGKRALGTVALFLHPTEAELKTLYVHPSLRRQGWGRRLTELVMKEALKAGRTRLVLWSDTRFEGAHRLYRSLGFTQKGHRRLNDINQSAEFGFFKELSDA